MAKLKEQAKRRKIDGNEIKVDRRDDKRGNERIWMKKRSGKTTNAKIVGEVLRNSRKCNSISNIRSQRSVSQKPVIKPEIREI